MKVLSRGLKVLYTAHRSQVGDHPRVVQSTVNGLQESLFLVFTRALTSEGANERYSNCDFPHNAQLILSKRRAQEIDFQQHE